MLLNHSLDILGYERIPPTAPLGCFFFSYLQVKDYVATRHYEIVRKCDVPPEGSCQARFDFPRLAFQLP